MSSIKKGRKAHGDPVTKETAQAYYRKAQQLINRWHKVCPANGSRRLPINLIEWIIEQKPTWAAASWRQNKSAILFYFHGHRAAAPKHAEAFDRAIARLIVEGQDGCAEATTQTSAMKAKCLPDADHIKIRAKLERSLSRYAGILIDLLHAGRLTGLRPIEWRQARLVPLPNGDGPVVLEVVNAKGTQGRSHGETRTLTWPVLDPETIAVLQRCLDWAAQAAAKDCYDADLDGMQRLLRDTCRRLWPRRKYHYALYSCRHQFAADAKRVYSPEEVAALMGHGSDTTATQHYGRPSRGKGGRQQAPNPSFPLPEPNPAEVARVRRVLAGRRQRLDDFEAGRAARPAL